MGWPKFTASLWMAAPEGGLAAIAYAPSVVRTRVNGTEVTIEEQTNYPFEEAVRFTVHSRQPASFSVLLRIPDWRREPRLQVSGQEITTAVGRTGFVTIDRAWQDGDVIELKLPHL